MCHPAWGRARTEAQRLNDLARLRRVRDRIDREYAQPPVVEQAAGPVRNQEALVTERPIA